MFSDSSFAPALAHSGTPPAAFWSKGESGLKPGFLHEFHAAEPEDIGAAAGLVAGLAIAAARLPGAPAIWLRARRGGQIGNGVIQGPGWAEMGGAPERCLFVMAQDELALLRAGLDAVRSRKGRGGGRGGGGVVVIEARGRLRELDLTASRRLSLAAAKAGVLLLLLRSEAEPVPSAAQTRWAVASAPSRALPARAPGAPCFDLELLRHRAGPAGARWRLEWDRDRRQFRDSCAAAALPGAVVSVPAGRTAAAGGGAAGIDAGGGGGRRAA